MWETCACDLAKSDARVKLRHRRNSLEAAVRGGDKTRATKVVQTLCPSMSRKRGASEAYGSERIVHARRLGTEERETMHIRAQPRAAKEAVVTKWHRTMLLLGLFLLSWPMGTLQQTGGLSSVSARSYCYSVNDPILPTSCASIRLAAGQPAIRGLRTGDSTAAYLQLNYVPLRNLSAPANASNVMATESALSSFFPKVDVYSTLTLNGSNALSYLDARKRLWEDVTISFHLLHNATVFRSVPKSWFAYNADMDILYYIPYRGVIVTLWDGLVSSIEWEEVSKVFSLCPLDVGEQLEMCPVQCNATDFAGCDVKVHLMWSGTDAQGRPLQSVEKSIYRLQYFW
ncbi:hypothetical protein DFJ74DRAFT_330794 [Hyaloraphidium curvatum]|nr:hypothetical protein DFJ74DRAFT_330794 [Hyaloraphidium curvatum]